MKVIAIYVGGWLALLAVLMLLSGDWWHLPW